MPCCKEFYLEVSNLQDLRVIKNLCDKVLADELFGFLQVDIQVRDELLEKFSEFCPLFVIDAVPEDQIPQHMKDCQEGTVRKTARGTKKLLGATKTTRILLYMPMLKWYLSHDFKVTSIHKRLKYESGKPFSWFPEEDSKAKHDGDIETTWRYLQTQRKLILWEDDRRSNESPKDNVYDQ